MAFAQAAFLPTATEAVIEETPPEHRGLAMALFSQCFTVSAIVAPLLGGSHAGSAQQWVDALALDGRCLPGNASGTAQLAPPFYSGWIILRTEPQG
jgi:MFS family permease